MRQEQFYSVEFKMSDLPYLFQFKIWKSKSKQLFFLVDENSKVHKRLRKGDVIEMKYYGSRSHYPTKLITQIVGINKNDIGRFKGRYSIGIEIVQGAGKK